MKIDHRSQLGLRISENHDLQLRIIAQQVKNIKKLVLLPPRLDATDGVQNEQLGFVNNNKPYEDVEFKLFVQLLLFVELSELTVEVLEPKQKTGSRKDTSVEKLELLILIYKT